MKRVYILTLAICLIMTGSIYAQQVAIFYDGALPTLGGIGNGQAFADLLVEKLTDKKITAEVFDSDAIADYLEANPTGIFLISQGIFPGTIFANQGEDDPVYDWLREGGIGGFAGDYPFYYWDNTNNVAGGGGQQKIFGTTVTVNPGQVLLEPTDLGKELMPSIEEWSADRPVNIQTLDDNDFEFEVYAESAGGHADPVAYRTEDMEGWFINFYTRCCLGALPAHENMATGYAELISNRFIGEGQAVNPTGKTSIIWGELKSIYR